MRCVTAGPGPPPPSLSPTCFSLVYTEYIKPCSGHCQAFPCDGILAIARITQLDMDDSTRQNGVCVTMLGGGGGRGRVSARGLRAIEPKRDMEPLPLITPPSPPLPCFSAHHPVQSLSSQLPLLIPVRDWTRETLPVSPPLRWLRWWEGSQGGWGYLQYTELVSCQRRGCWSLSCVLD